MAGQVWITHESLGSLESRVSNPMQALYSEIAHDSCQSGTFCFFLMINLSWIDVAAICAATHQPI